MTSQLDASVGAVAERPAGCFRTLIYLVVTVAAYMAYTRLIEPRVVPFCVEYTSFVNALLLTRLAAAVVTISLIIALFETVRRDLRNELSIACSGAIWRILTSAASLALVAFVLSMVGTYICGRLGFLSASHRIAFRNATPIQDEGIREPTALLLLTLTAYAAAEEFVFRGVVLRSLRDLFQARGAAVLLSSLFFAYAHRIDGAPSYEIDAFVLAVVLAAYNVRQLQQRLVTVWLAHLAYNLTKLTVARAIQS